MYTLLIVDDEEIEREGMAQLILWEKYGYRLAGTAKNGAEGLEKIGQLHPDIAIVDIKMPVMNGIEMIRQGQAAYPDTAYVVLSGYGDYEYTSQAMELGVRHYILKPCDDAKIMPVLDRAVQELEARRGAQAQNQKNEREARLLKPIARQQMFRDLLLGRAQPGAGARALVEELGGAGRQVMLLDFRLKGGFDALERYVVGNMLGDLLPDGALLMTAGVDKDVLALAGAAADHDADGAVARLKKEFKRFEQAPMLSAASRVGTLDELPLLFRQVQELLGLNMDTDAGGLLRPGHTAFLPETVGEMFDFDAMKQAADYETLVAELALDFLKMEAKNFDGRQRQQLCALAWKLLFADKPAPSPTLAGWAGALTAAWGLPHPDERSREIYLAIYENVGDPDFSLQRIAQERLYVSEDHLRRVFSQLTGKRFSVYLEQCRIRLACRLLEYQPDTKISRLAELVGYPLDGPSWWATRWTGSISAKYSASSAG